MIPRVGWPDPPNNVPIHLSNDPIQPCLWSSQLFYGTGNFLVGYNAAMSELYLSLGPPWNWHYFIGHEDPCDIGPFTNEATWPDHAPIGGTGVILDMPLSIIILLTDTYNLQPDQDALYDIVDSAIPDHVCVRLTGRTSPGSVLVLVDTGAIP
jgi:hypothetical protein